MAIDLKCGCRLEPVERLCSYHEGYEDGREASPEDLLLMNDDATVTRLTRCRECRFLFRDIAKHVEESVTVSDHSDGTMEP